MEERVIPLRADLPGPPKRKIGKNPKRERIQQEAKERAAIQSELNVVEQGQIGPATQAGIL